MMLSLSIGLQLSTIEGDMCTTRTATIMNHDSHHRGLANHGSKKTPGREERSSGNRKHQGICTKQTEATNYDLLAVFGTGSFDVCLLLFVLHHIAHSVEMTLREAARVAKRVPQSRWFWGCGSARWAPSNQQNIARLLESSL